MAWPELAFYHNCVLLSHTSSSWGPTTDSIRPLWVSPPECNLLRQLVPMQPITFLTRLNISLHQDSTFVSCPYTLASGNRPCAALTQVCWILRFNPHLQDVTLHNLVLKKRREASLFALSILGLMRLTRLDLNLFVQHYPQISLEEAVFACVPTSLQYLKIITSHLDTEDSTKLTNLFTGREEPHSTWWNSPADDLINRSQVYGILFDPPPLPKLNVLWMWDTWNDDFTVDALCDIFTRCPNIHTLRLPLLPGEFNADSIVETITTNYQRICHLILDASEYHEVEPEDGDGEPQIVNSWLPFEIMKLLPEQQVEHFQCTTSLFELDEQQAWAIFRRHSTTLTTLILKDCSGLESKGLQVILVTCGALSTLEVGHFEKDDGFYQAQLLGLQLFHAIDFPWICTKLRSLALPIVILPEMGELNYSRVPYYCRKAPIVLSLDEQALFGQLERLYIQIGKLIELEELNLHTMWGSDTVSRKYGRQKRTLSYFPLMLSLGNGYIRRPGYLHHLRGLNKLKVLRGSVYADTSETKVTTGVMEAAWMLENWPSLEQAEFFPARVQPSPPFLWMIDQRKKSGGTPLRLSYRSVL
ncbi:hypothetical protein BGX24_006235 [Mortierella sp. AD032]|nr:hypothetical protein BGX24_006235 [Mortierella sp. AD032]